MIREIVNVAGGALLSSFHSRETRTLTDCEINDNNNNNVETMKRKPSSKRIIGTVIIWGNDWKPIIEIKTDKFQFGFKRPLIDNNIRSRNERLFKKCSAYLFERIYKKKNVFRTFPAFGYTVHRRTSKRIIFFGNIWLFWLLERRTGFFFLTE